MNILIHSRVLLAAILSHDRLAAVQASHSFILRPLLRFCLAVEREKSGQRPGTRLLAGDTTIWVSN